MEQQGVMQKLNRRIANFALIFLLIGATLHVRQFLIEWRFLNGATRLGVLTSPFFAELQVFFIVAFLVGSAGLLIHRRLGFMISAAGLLAVFLGYVAWRVFTIRQLRLTTDDPFFSGHPEFGPTHMLGLVGAHWWDFVVLGGCLFLFLWELTLFRKPRLDVNLSN
jgi:hypothetical protein